MKDTSGHNDEEHAPQDLCMRCGLCCSGAIFSWAPIKANDKVDALKERGARFGEECFFFPCAALKGSICTIFPERPSICAEYKCKLLKRFEKKGVSWEEAVEIVNKTKLHRERYEAALRKVYKEEGIKSLTEHYQHFLDTHGYETDTVSFLKKYGDIPLEYVAFQVRLHRYFDEEYAETSRKYSVSR